MKNRKGRIERLTEGVYGQLTPGERFRLMIEHAAQKNHEEAKRIDRACPLKNCRMTDQAYGNLCMAGWQLAREADSVIRRYACAMDLLQAQMLRTILCSLHWWHSQKRAHSDGSEAAPVDGEPPSARAIRTMEQARPIVEGLLAPLQSGFLRAIAQGLKCEWIAFDRCCRQHLDVDGQVLLRAWGAPAAVQWLEGFEPALEKLELDEEHQEATERALAHFARGIAHLHLARED